MTLWMLLLALAVPPEVNLVGRLMAADVLCAAIVLWACVTGRLPSPSPSERMFYILGFLWLFAQIVTDVYVDTSADDYLRGWSKIVFFMVNFTAVRILTERDLDRSIFFLVIVLAAVAVKFSVGTGTIESTGDFATDWRFGYGAAFSVGVMYLGVLVRRHLRTRFAEGGAGLLAAAVDLAMNARSLFGQTAFAALAGLIAESRGVKPVTAAALVLSSVLVVGGGFASIEVYSYAADQGLLGRDAREKYERQSNNDLGLILSGRTELLGSLDAIADSPIVGYGSYARDAHYATLRFARLQQAGIPTSRDIESDRIPTHSFLFGAWVEAGIVGAIFWGWVLFVAGRGLLVTMRTPVLYTSIVVFAATLLVWDVLFSPFGLDRRIVTPLLVVIMMSVGEAPARTRVAPPARTRSPRRALRRFGGRLPFERR